MRNHLTRSERLVMFALAEDATRTNAEVAERVGMKESTVAEHKRSLLRNRHMFFANFPSLHRLGCDFIGEFFGTTNPATPIDERNRRYRDFFNRMPQVFDSVSAEGFLMASAAFVDLSEMLLFRESHDFFFEDSSPPKGMMSTALFPFDISRCCYVYNFAPTLHRVFDFDFPDPMSRRPTPQRKERASLSNTEARALHEIVASPTATDAQIGQKIRRSRQSVTDMRHSFIEQQLYTRVAVPTFHTMEFGALAYLRMRFKPNATFDRKTAVAGEDWWRYSCYTLERDSELFGIYIFSNFREYAALMSRYIGPLLKSDMVAGAPEIFAISMENQVDLVDSAFAPLVQHLLFRSP